MHLGAFCIENAPTLWLQLSSSCSCNWVASSCNWFVSGCNWVGPNCNWFISSCNRIKFVAIVPSVAISMVSLLQLLWCRGCNWSHAAAIGPSLVATGLGLIAIGSRPIATCPSSCNWCSGAVATATVCAFAVQSALPSRCN